MRSRGSRDDMNCKYVSISVKDSSIGLFKLILFLIIFVVGVVIGLLSNSHVDRFFQLQTQQFYGNQTIWHESGYINVTVSCPVIPKCDKEDCLSMGNFLAPKNLSHRMMDNELFWRASLVPSKTEYPYVRKPKVAFMFLTRGPLPFLPLWERFFTGQSREMYSIYVHAVPGFELDVTNTSAFYRRQIPSQKVKWGTVSLFDAERRLLANALLDFSNERFILLSESCIPVHNFPTVYKYLTESQHSFVQSYDDPSRYGRGRYSRQMLPDIHLRDWRKGSQWFELSRSLAVGIVSDTKYYTLFKKHCLPACYPDEHYLPTYIQKLYGSLNSNRSVTYVDWSKGGPHPAAFTAENITEGFIQYIRNNGTLCPYNFDQTRICYLFARKFGPSALEPLLNLSLKVMGF
ncbi:Core-2/I-branching beta-1,6-N-acetylglucosaminyltransferase family protein [Heracleum sosnowskyi]|uniref:Core-2/I-branching beta-1,6-N-acetylglucosaminyltransferase family protein n=1 Tax=Heracleum sosnowskyi TaxID=360622 RepID=A0AAD8M390_9APIA|nr:Core-2/I-branching beta-1,6-N-acetylglucosaminyltransferase family protein [Heracleum sosnowskyi]